MQISGVSIKPGLILEYEGKLWVVTKTQNVKPGKGGAFNQVEMKAVKEGTKQNVRFRSDESVEQVQLERRDYQFLYPEDDKLVFMDNESFEQVSLDAELLEDRVAYLQDGMTVVLEMYEGAPISVRLPEQVTLQIVEADPVVKGQTAASSYKPAKLENGIRVLVPPFIESGEKIVVSTATSEYVERAK